MRVGDYGGLFKNISADKVCGFSAYTAKGCKLFYSVGTLPPKFSQIDLLIKIKSLAFVL